MIYYGRLIKLVRMGQPSLSKKEVILLKWRVLCYYLQKSDKNNKILLYIKNGYKNQDILEMPLKIEIYVCKRSSGSIQQLLIKKQ